MKYFALTKLAVLLLFSLASVTGTLHAETSTATATEITTLPATISTPGVYFIKKNFSVNMTSGNAINITASNVVLDLNGFSIINTNGLSNTASGITASNPSGVTLSNVTARNGTVQGFRYGINFAYSGTDSSLVSKYQVEQIRVFNAGRYGIITNGGDAIVRDCLVTQTGGYPSVGNYIGILGNGSNARIINNHIADVDITGTLGTGIWASRDTSFVIGNTISGCYRGLYFSGSSGYYALYRDNLVGENVVQPYVGGGTDAGGNY
ncbi:MAG TPA: hypothetical protein VIT91_21030 [Chthoniobacterales bacterium]